eukprot:TRINITY_DN22818_c0_g1_i3.p1 TRINITY_DN22818_c0_g1~~TRINITY_DN22818_c0_g1_i3.p1  ORF type:complete len:453 (+),score=59.48 TRINITY_DN22818_c0_g1_i3:162-1520(+)
MKRKRQQGEYGNERSESKLLLYSILSMGIVLLVILFFSFYSAGKGQDFEVSSVEQNDKQELQYLIALFRHGDRTAIRRYAFETVQWKWDYGKLTISGMIQAFKFGRYLNAKIEYLLGRKPNINDVEIFATDVDRTFDTGNCVLLGIYARDSIQKKDLQADLETCRRCRPNSGTRSPPECLSQCMGIKTASPEVPVIQTADERILLQMDVCKGWWDDTNKLEESSMWNLMSKKNFENALEFIRNITHNESTICQIAPQPQHGCKNMCQDINLDAVERVWGNLQCAISHEQTYIDGYTNDYISDMLTDAALYVWHSRFNSTHGQKVGKHAGGILLHDILDRMQNFNSEEAEIQMDGQNKSRVLLYSAHDTTIMSLLSALQMSTSAHIPEYVSHVIFELWRDREDGSKQIVVTYDNQMLDWFACPEGKCLLEDLVSATADFTMTFDDCIPYKQQC